MLVWVKRVWRCMEPRCGTRTWTERSPAIRPRAGWTERARAEACRRVGELGHTVAAVAVEFGVGWATVMAAVREYGRPLVEDPDRLAGVHTLGVDETAFLAATPTAGTVFATGIVALNGRARLLDVVEGRSGKALCDWVSEREPAWRDQISVAALDPYRGYATALRTSLPHAVRVLDAFHVVRLGLDAVDQIRRRVQQDTLGQRGHAADPLFGIRRLLRRGHEHHSDRSWARMLAGLAAGDEDEQVGRAWIAAQELRLLYREPTRDRAEQRLLRWFTAVAEHEIPELIRLARTLDAWRPELLAYFDTGGISNRPTEAVNGLIKKVKRVGMATATSPTTASASSCTAAPTGTLPPPPRSEGGYHARLRRAPNGLDSSGCGYNGHCQCARAVPLAPGERDRFLPYAHLPRRMLLRRDDPPRSPRLGADRHQWSDVIPRADPTHPPSDSLQVPRPEAGRRWIAAWLPDRRRPPRAGRHPPRDGPHGTSSWPPGAAGSGSGGSSRDRDEGTRGCPVPARLTPLNPGADQVSSADGTAVGHGPVTSARPSFGKISLSLRVTTPVVS